MPVKTIRIVIWLLVIAVCAVAISVYLLRNNLIGANGFQSKMLPAFSLRNHQGETITNAQLLGKPLVIFFGFTHCPDVCPTRLAEISALLEETSPQTDNIQPVFITLDPKRDTPEEIAEYIRNFSNRIIGITGDEKAIIALAKAFYIYRKIVPLDEGNYVLDHTASILLIRSDGSLMGTIAWNESAQSAQEKLLRLAK